MASTEWKLDLGELHDGVNRRVASGQYEDESDVIRSALRALDREDAALDALLKKKVEASLADERPSIPATEVFKRLKAHHAQRMKSAARDD